MINTDEAAIVSKKAFSLEIGVSIGTIDGWMKRHWTNGIEYTVIGRTTLIHRQRATDWLMKRFLPTDDKMVRLPKPRRGGR